AGIGGEELQRRRVRGVCRHHGGVFHGAASPQPLHHLRDRRLLLADGHVDAVDAQPLLVEDGIDRDGGLARLTIADDQLALPAADRDHRVDRLDARLQRLLDRLAGDDAGRLDLDLAVGIGFDRPSAIDRLTQAVDDAAEQRLAHGHFGDAPGPLDLVALANALVGPHRGDTDVVFLEVEDQAADAVGELDQLTGHRLRQPVHAGDAVADLEHGADLGDLDLLSEFPNLVLENAADLVRPDFHGPVSPERAPRARNPDCRRLAAAQKLVPESPELRSQAP